MKTLIAAVAAIALFGAGAASAQTSTSADVKVEGTNTKAKAHVRKHHRSTTGRGGIETRDNNASARGSILPGKDRLNSKAYVVDH